MTKARLAVAFLVALALVPAPVAAAAGEPILSATVAGDTVTPGEETTLEVTVVNTGRVDQRSATNPSLTQRVTTARGLVVDVDAGDAPITIRDGGERAVGSLPEGATPPLSIPISVDEDAEQGTYEVPVEVNYTHTERVLPDGTEEWTNVSRTLNVTVEVDDAASFAVFGVASQARVGATGSVEVTLVNDGSQAARDASVSLTSQNADLTFGASGSASRYVGAWEPGERRTLTYEVSTARTAKPGAYAMRATVDYEDEYGVPSRSAGLSFAVTPQREQTFSVAETASNVSVGDEGALSLTMVNEGPVAVRDASVSLSSTAGDLVFGGAAQASRFVGAWEPGERRTVVFDVTAAPGAETRSYTMQAEVAYEDAEGDPARSPTVSVGVTPAPERRTFAVTDVTGDLEVGAEGTLNGTITNTGTAAASNVVVSFATQKPGVTLLESESPVGDLEPGGSATFSFPVEIAASGEPGPKQFELVATYRDENDDKRRSDTVDALATVAPDRDTFAVATARNGVTAGGSSPLEVTVTNQGSEPVSAVSAKLFANAPISATDSEAFIDRLEPGQSETVTFAVAASSGALAKGYPVEMDFQYDQPDGDTVTSRTYRTEVTVSEPEDDGGDLPLPLPVIALLALVVLAVAGYLVYDRVSE